MKPFHRAFRTYSLTGLRIVLAVLLLSSQSASAAVVALRSVSVPVGGSAGAAGAAASSALSRTAPELSLSAFGLRGVLPGAGGLRPELITGKAAPKVSAAAVSRAALRPEARPSAVRTAGGGTRASLEGETPEEIAGQKPLISLTSDGKLEEGVFNKLAQLAHISALPAADEALSRHFDGSRLLETGPAVAVQGRSGSIANGFVWHQPQTTALDLQSDVLETPEPEPARPATPGKRIRRWFAASWPVWTQRLTNAAAVPFIIVQGPQIVKNFTMLASGAVGPMAILPWMGYATGILANMLLLSYFVSQKEAGAARIQAIGILTSGTVISQLFAAGFMPGFAFYPIVSLIGAGLLLNYLNYKDKVPEGVWKVWKRVSGLAGLVVLPMALMETFCPGGSVIAGAAAGTAGLVYIVLQKWWKGLPKKYGSLWADLSGWMATLLFMFGPIAQLAANFANPEALAGLSLITLLLGVFGNGLMLSRAVLTRDRIWFVGSFWAVAMGGEAVLLSMFLLGGLSLGVLAGYSVIFPAYMAFILSMSKKSHGFKSWRRVLSFLWSDS